MAASNGNMDLYFYWRHLTTKAKARFVEAEAEAMDVDVECPIVPASDEDNTSIYDAVLLMNLSDISSVNASFTSNSTPAEGVSPPHSPSKKSRLNVDGDASVCSDNTQGEVKALSTIVQSSVTSPPRKKNITGYVAQVAREPPTTVATSVVPATSVQQEATRAVGAAVMPVTEASSTSVLPPSKAMAAVATRPNTTMGSINVQPATKAMGTEVTSIITAATRLTNPECSCGLDHCLFALLSSQAKTSSSAGQTHRCEGELADGARCGLLVSAKCSLEMGSKLCLTCRHFALEDQLSMLAPAVVTLSNNLPVMPEIKIEPVYASSLSETERMSPPKSLPRSAAARLQPVVNAVEASDLELVIKYTAHPAMVGDYLDDSADATAIVDEMIPDDNMSRVSSITTATVFQGHPALSTITATSASSNQKSATATYGPDEADEHFKMLGLEKAVHQLPDILEWKCNWGAENYVVCHDGKRHYIQREFSSTNMKVGQLQFCIQVITTVDERTGRETRSVRYCPHFFGYVGGDACYFNPLGTPLLARCALVNTKTGHVFIIVQALLTTCNRPVAHFALFDTLYLNNPMAGYDIYDDRMFMEGVKFDRADKRRRVSFKGPIEPLHYRVEPLYELTGSVSIDDICGRLWEEKAQQLGIIYDPNYKIRAGANMHGVVTKEEREALAKEKAYAPDLNEHGVDREFLYWNSMKNDDLNLSGKLSQLSLLVVGL